MKSTRFGLVLSAALISNFAGTVLPVSYAQPPTPAAGQDGNLDRAARALSEGNAVLAREILLDLSSLSLSDSERARSINMLRQADEKIRSQDPRLVAVQRARVAFDRDDLVTARRLASPIASGRGESNAAEAESLLTAIDARQTALQSQVDSTLADATRALEAGEYARAKGLADRVTRWGLTLSPAQTDALEAARARVVAAEQERGQAFRAETGPSPLLAAGMLAEPGVIERRDPSGEASTTTSSTTSSTIAVVSQPSDQSGIESSSSSSAPTTTSTPAPAPAVSGEDPITAARRAEANNLLAEADAAFNESRFNEAQIKYNRLRTQYRELLSSDQSRTVEDRLAEARLRLRGSGGDARDLAGFIEQGTVARQQAQAEFDNQLVQAQDALKGGDVIRARDSAARARLILNSNRERFAETEFQSLQTKVSDFLKGVDAEEQRLAEARSKSQAERNQLEARRVAEQGARERDRKIREAIDRVRALQVEMKYDEALQVVDQILFLDPINPTGLLLRDVLTSARIYRDWNETNIKRGVAIAEQRLQNQAASVAPSGIVNYPTDWPSVIKDRGEPVTLAESVETRSTLAALANTRRPVDFTETPLERAVDWVAKSGNIKMDVDWPSLEKIGINKDTPVTVNLSTIRLDQLLDLIVSKVSPDPTSAAAWEVQDGILRVASAEAINTNRLMVIYDIRDLLVEVRDYSEVPQFDLNSALQAGSGTGGGGGSTSPIQSTTTQQQTGRTVEERTDELVRLITEQIDPDNWRENGGAVGFVSRFKGNLLITNTPKNHRAIGALLRRLREIRAMQVNIEARFLLVSQDFFEQIGFNFDVYLNADSINERSISLPSVQNRFVDQAGNDSNINPTVRASDFFDQNGRAVRTFTSNRTPVITDVDADTGARTIEFQATPTSVTNQSGFGPVGFRQNSLGITNALLNSSFARAVNTAGRGFTAAGTFLDDIQVDFLLQATQADRRNVSLQAPRLTITNGQEANIQVVDQTGYISNLTPITNQGAVAFQPVPAALNTGVLLRVRGTVSADRRYVTVDITTQVSALKRFVSRQVTAAVGGGGGLGGGSAVAFQSGEFQTPEVSLTSISTTVTVPDQGTMLLGGQRLVTEEEIESGVPVLSKIPVLNRFFSNRAESKTESTLLILVKPTILVQSEQENKAHPGLIDSLNAGLGG
mgnify:CR=1 FL=1